MCSVYFIEVSMANQVHILKKNKHQKHKYGKKLFIFVMSENTIIFIAILD